MYSLKFVVKKTTASAEAAKNQLLVSDICILTSTDLFHRTAYISFIPWQLRMLFNDQMAQYEKIIKE